MDNVKHAVFDLCTMCWNGSPLPTDWVDDALVCLYKGKGEKEFVTNIVESLFWMQMAWFFPESC